MRSELQDLIDRILFLSTITTGNKWIVLDILKLKILLSEQVDRWRSATNELKMQCKLLFVLQNRPLWRWCCVNSCSFPLATRDSKSCVSKEFLREINIIWLTAIATSLWLILVGKCQSSHDLSDRRISPQTNSAIRLYLHCKFTRPRQRSPQKWCTCPFLAWKQSNHVCALLGTVELAMFSYQY